VHLQEPPTEYLQSWLPLDAFWCAQIQVNRTKVQAGRFPVRLTFGIPQNIMAESFLSFVGLGLGLEPPYASWGTLANEGWRAYRTYPYLIFFPGVVLFFMILAFNFLFLPTFLWVNV